MEYDIWFLDSFVDINGVSSLIVGAEGGLYMYKLSEENEYEIIKSSDDPCIVSMHGYCNHVKYFVRNLKEYLIFEFAERLLYSVCLNDRTKSFVWNVDRSHAGCKPFEFVREGILAVNRGKYVDFIRLDRIIENTPRVGDINHVSKLEKSIFKITSEKIPEEDVMKLHKFQNIVFCPKIHVLFCSGSYGDRKLMMIDLSSLPETNFETSLCDVQGFAPLSTEIINETTIILLGNEKGQIHLYEYKNPLSLIFKQTLQLESRHVGYGIIITNQRYLFCLVDRSLSIFDLNLLNRKTAITTITMDPKIRRGLYSLCWVKERNEIRKKKNIFYVSGDKGFLSKYKSIGEISKKNMDLDEEERRNYIIDSFEEKFTFCTIKILFVDSKLIIKYPMWFPWKN